MLKTYYQRTRNFFTILHEPVQKCYPSNVGPALGQEVWFFNSHGRRNQVGAFEWLKGTILESICDGESFLITNDFGVFKVSRCLIMPSMDPIPFDLCALQPNP